MSRPDATPFNVAPGATVMNVAAAAWHRAYLAQAKALGFAPVWSLSFEILDQHCPAAWKQRGHDGAPALTGWVPPSTLVSPAVPDGIAYLGRLAVALLTIGAEAGVVPRLQIGEPWWWITDGRPCLYDDATVALLGTIAPIDLRAPLDDATLALLDRAASLLANATTAILAAARTVAPTVETHLLVYLPTLLAPICPQRLG